MSKRALLFAAAVSAASLAVPAYADTYSFVLTGSRTATFLLDSSPTPSSFSAFQFQLSNVPGVFGTSVVAPTISFGVSPAGDFEIDGTSLGFTQFAGPDLFTGPTSAPTFLTGMFQLSSIVSGSSTLTISALPAAAVPETSAWASLAVGLALIGFTMRRRTIRFTPLRV